MEGGKIASDRNISSQFVQLTADRECQWSARERQKRKAIGTYGLLKAGGGRGSEPMRVGLDAQ